MSKIWFITGTSSGFGKLWAEAALERGDRVAATARTVEALDDLVERFPQTVLPLELDVTDRDGAFAAVAAAVQRFGRLDVVVNNAGYGHFGMVEELTERELRQQMETNFFGAVWVTQAALPVLRRQRSGHLLQVTSEGGVRAYPGIGAYHASKWALEGLTEALAQEVEPFGIHVTCVEPGPYATDWLDRGSRRSAELPDYAPARPEYEFEVGDAAATKPAILQLVDAEQPPRRLILGRLFPAVEALYNERLQTWRDWQPVSEAAFG
ncbi:short-chain dehydrogenase/reductase [Paractinoplanes abujensis]|uniref:NAD(P)-dependent dehydrogenase (Short-subunit alcohol dehydrogenase family) n=1 Tax=Paractinoplanes abujensis TaxID=882441 RepID=A0A7W7CP09_9ACTN|nr:SDR family NAD(P)-dependent oxidoreductase [Actinoplanes abujensis]MBB4692085.1 NAD(P)-dependent dehydrogenase (short-subunit alcohol dehydrogenase family) [Actinoplanes abujensis]GID16500.1 short-chain dehydrogenase/reductase [Actinoplanes abujensis]